MSEVNAPDIHGRRGTGVTQISLLTDSNVRFDDLSTEAISRMMEMVTLSTRQIAISDLGESRRQEVVIIWP